VLGKKYLPSYMREKGVFVCTDAPPPQEITGKNRHGSDYITNYTKPLKSALNIFARFVFVSVLVFAMMPGSTQVAAQSETRSLALDDLPSYDEYPWHLISPSWIAVTATVNRGFHGMAPTVSANNPVEVVVLPRFGLPAWSYTYITRWSCIVGANGGQLIGTERAERHVFPPWSDHPATFGDPNMHIIFDGLGQGVFVCTDVHPPPPHQLIFF